jgi:hypothetical protein
LKITELELIEDELYEEFQGWSEFSQRTYDLFIREILLNLADANRGYGRAMKYLYGDHHQLSGYYNP